MSRDNSALRKVVRALVDRGCEVVQGRKHYRVSRDGRLLASISVSPSDGNWVKQVERDLRRNGLLERGERLI